MKSLRKLKIVYVHTPSTAILLTDMVKYQDSFSYIKKINVSPLYLDTIEKLNFLSHHSQITIEISNQAQSITTQEQNDYFRSIFPLSKLLMTYPARCIEGSQYFEGLICLLDQQPNGIVLAQNYYSVLGECFQRLLTAEKQKSLIQFLTTRTSVPLVSFFPYEDDGCKTIILDLLFRELIKLADIIAKDEHLWERHILAVMDFLRQALHKFHLESKCNLMMQLIQRVSSLPYLKAAILFCILFDYGSEIDDFRLGNIIQFENKACSLWRMGCKNNVCCLYGFRFFLVTLRDYCLNCSSNLLKRALAENLNRYMLCLSLFNI